MLSIQFLSYAVRMSPKQTTNLTYWKLLQIYSSLTHQISLKYSENICVFTSRQTSRHVDSDLKSLENLQGIKIGNFYNCALVQMFMCEYLYSFPLNDASNLLPIWIFPPSHHCYDKVLCISPSKWHSICKYILFLLSTLFLHEIFQHFILFF